MTERVEACVLEFVQEDGGTYQKCATHGAYVGGECLGRVADLEAALAQAERERDAAYVELNREQIAHREERELLRAEVERLLIENDAARKSIGEAWDTAVADGGKIRSLEAEVERLKADLKVADEYAHQMVSRWNKTEADLARVRAALEEIAEDADGVAAEVIVGVAERRTWRSIARKARAALEGR